MSEKCSRFEDLLSRLSCICRHAHPEAHPDRPPTARPPALASLQLAKLPSPAPAASRPPTPSSTDAASLPWLFTEEVSNTSGPRYPNLERRRAMANEVAGGPWSHGCPYIQGLCFGSSARRQQLSCGAGRFPSGFLRSGDRPTHPRSRHHARCDCRIGRSARDAAPCDRRTGGRDRDPSFSGCRDGRSARDPPLGASIDARPTGRNVSANPAISAPSAPGRASDNMSWGESIRHPLPRAVRNGLL